MAEMRTKILALVLLAAASPLAAQTADSTRRSITLDEAIALSLRTQPGVIQAEDLGRMNDDPFVFAMANPNPEVKPEEDRKSVV